MNRQIELIRREIERRMNCYKTEKTEENIGHRDKLLLGARIAQCEELLSFIDSMEEEPKPKFKIGDKVVSESGKYAEIESIDTDKYWCKGENGMSIPFKYQDKWELVEEPVSEELEEAANAYISNENNYSHSRTDTFKAGARWQAEKDLELTWEDISAIRHTMARLRRQFSNDNQVVNNEEFCREVLKRFKEMKGE